MNKKFVILGVVLVVIICVLCAGVYTLTSPNTAPSQKALDVVTVIDATGAEVTVPYPVNRIVCLSAVETVYALGAGGKIVAITGMLTADIRGSSFQHLGPANCRRYR